MSAAKFLNRKIAISRMTINAPLVQFGGDGADAGDDGCFPGRDGARKSLAGFWQECP
jgi:hypothetical protein